MVFLGWWAFLMSQVPLYAETWMEHEQIGRGVRLRLVPGATTEITPQEGPQVLGKGLQGFLAHKKPLPPRPLQ